MQPPETRYTRSGDVNIAYQVVGDGHADLVWIPGFAQHVELSWEETYRRAWLTRLAERFRLIVFDKRGTGASDRVEGSPPLEVRMDDIRAVLDAAASERPIIFAVADGVPLALLFAATYPQRTRALVLTRAKARSTWAPDYPWAEARDERLRWIEDMERRWPESLYESVASSAPSLTEEEQRAFARVTRLSVSPGAAAAWARMNTDVDVRHVLGSIRAPTLIIERRVSRGLDAARVLAAAIPDAQLALVDGIDAIPVVGDVDAILREVFRFAGETPDAVPPPETRLATVLFTDIVGSTARAADLGDRGWHDLLARHHAAVRRELVRFRGIEHDTAGDGFFASFDGPARAIRCACAIREAVSPLNLELRAGLHTGECEVLDEKVAGIAVSIGARVAARAATGEVLVSQTVKDLVAGSGIAFDDRGAAELKGVPGEWRFYAVSDA